MDKHHPSVVALPEALRARLLLSSQTIGAVPASALAYAPERVSVDVVRSGAVEDTVGAEDGLVCALPPQRVAAPGSAEDEEVRTTARKLLGDHAFFASASGVEQLRRLWAGRAARYAKDPFDALRDVVLIGKATAPPPPSPKDPMAEGRGHPGAMPSMAPQPRWGGPAPQSALPAAQSTPNAGGGGFRFIPPPSPSRGGGRPDAGVGAAAAAPPVAAPSPAPIDIGLHNPSVSRLHAAIVVGFFGLLGEQNEQPLDAAPSPPLPPPNIRNCCTWVVDLGSSNGTFVVVGAGTGGGSNSGQGGGIIGSLDFAAVEWYANACPQVVARLAPANRQQLIADARECGRLRLVPFAPFPLLGAACRRAFSTVRIGHASVELQIRAPAWAARFDEAETAAVPLTGRGGGASSSNPALTLLAAAAAGACASGGVRRDRYDGVVTATTADGPASIGAQQQQPGAQPCEPAGVEALRARLRVARGALDACPAVPPLGAPALPLEVEQRRAALTRAVDEMTAQVRALEAVVAPAGGGSGVIPPRRPGWRPNVL